MTDKLDTAEIRARLENREHGLETSAGIFREINADVHALLDALDAKDALVERLVVRLEEAEEMLSDLPDDDGSLAPVRATIIAAIRAAQEEGEGR